MLASSSTEGLLFDSSEIQLPPGFRFHPSDEELIVHYLNNRVTSRPLPASIIAEIDLYKFNPWELPDKAFFGEDEWFFYSPRDRKYSKGARPNRAVGLGYWKATETDKPILTSCGTTSIEVKKALAFYKGRPPKGTKTEWIVHEYRLLQTMIWTPKRKGSMRDLLCFDATSSISSDRSSTSVQDANSDNKNLQISFSSPQNPWKRESNMGGT
ncbi:hypothetical protein V6N12_035744 [Hibiscus sabdariffa]|uniref:NAC domain-containing protein n=1 Tax=Hibiscus sabdariffa TaxID=183260 RepID=A0ABR2EQD2_9ROSI